jgi:GTP-binding protein Era
VGIVGRPNVGKSTLLNALLKEKIAIVSPKPQTTRHRILGALTRGDAQAVFLDTPGLQTPEHALGRHMQEVAKAVLEEADVLIVMIDARVGMTEADEQVFRRVREALRHRGGSRVPAILLAINKVDLVKKPKILPLLEACAKTGLFAECVPISAMKEVNLDALLGCIIARLPEGPRWYEPEQRTDQTRERMVGEFVREQVLLATRQEVPHAVAVQVEAIEERDRVTAIQATILVERQGQKAILIGKGGSMLKQIGTAARQQLERLLGRKVHLELWVKVSENWREDERMLRELGYLQSGDA